MALAERQIRETTVQDGAAVERTSRVENPVAEVDHKKNVASRVVWYITGIVLSLLALRFLFALLGANAGSGFVNFIYSVTQPLVTPFFGIFGYDGTSDGSRFETFTLLAMLIYSLIGYGIAKVFTITRREN